MMRLRILRNARIAPAPQRVTRRAQKPDRRKRGYAGVIDRIRIRQRDQYLCQECLRHGLITPGTQVDHIVPLSAGGSDDDDENKQLLCDDCHARKTAQEAGGGRISARGQSDTPNRHPRAFFIPKKGDS